jgi:hypothetical protein
VAQEKTTGTGRLEQTATILGVLAYLTIETGQQFRVVRDDHRSESRYYVTMNNRVVGNIFATNDREAICMGLVRFTELIRNIPG